MKKKQAMESSFSYGWDKPHFWIWDFHLWAQSKKKDITSQMDGGTVGEK